MYENITHDFLLDRMLSRVSGKFDKREGSVIFDTHSPTALELQFIYIELERIINESYGDTASREFLVRRCRERGITPYPASKAVLKGEFAPADIDVAGKRFNIDSVNYTVTEKIGGGEYRVECETAGTAGNGQLGEMIPIDYIDGLQRAELTEVLIPGEDEEDTEELRKRYFNSFDEKAFGGNVRDYLEKTDAIAGVGSTKVTRVWNGGLRPADMIPSAEVREWYETVKPTLSGSIGKWLETVFNAAEQKQLTTGGTVLLTILDSDFGVPSETLLETVRETIDPDGNAGEGMGLAPIGHLVSVKGANGVKINISADITFDAGYGQSRLQSSIDGAVSDYLAELRKSWAEAPCLTVRISQIETRILGIKGIVDIENTAVNGSRENLTLGGFDVPVFGGVSVGERG